MTNEVGGMTHPMNTMVEKKVEYFTPLEITQDLRFHSKGCRAFDLDPCTSEDRPWDIASINWTEGGLEKPWDGRVWLNPPYGRNIGTWIKKLADHGEGTALIFARTDTEFFQQHVFQRASGILFLSGRIHFCDHTGKAYKHNAGAPSCLVAYGKRDWDILNSSVLEGARVRL